jgi:RimJ/RimL family protein N-acetyltransferase
LQAEITPQTKGDTLAPGVLMGKSVRLRPLRADDRATSVRWRNDPEIRDYVLGYRFPVTEELEAEWIDGVLKDQTRARLVLAIEDKADDALAGFVYLYGIDWFARNAEFGILIGDHSKQGRGLAQEALALMADYAFEALNLHRLYLRVAVFNKRALRLFRDFGFVQEGIQRQQAFLRGGYHDVVLFGLLREEYHAVRPPS